MLHSKWPPLQLCLMTSIRATLFLCILPPLVLNTSFFPYIHFYLYHSNRNIRVNTSSLSITCIMMSTTWLDSKRFIIIMSIQIIPHVSCPLLYTITCVLTSCQKCVNFKSMRRLRIVGLVLLQYYSNNSVFKFIPFN